MTRASVSSKQSAHAPLNNVNTPYSSVRLLKGGPLGQVNLFKCNHLQIKSKLGCIRFQHQPLKINIQALSENWQNIESKLIKWNLGLMVMGLDWGSEGHGLKPQIDTKNPTKISSQIKVCLYID